MEFFQILLNGNWLAAVYPNSYEADCDRFVRPCAAAPREADFRRNGHVVLGPDSRGGRSYWCLQARLHHVRQVKTGNLEIRWLGLAEQLLDSAIF